MRRAFTVSSISAFALVASLAATSGCGSNPASYPDGGGGSDAPMINCGDNQPIDPTAVIDDMEMPDYMAVYAGGRTGAWWAGGDDKSPGASITPMGDAAAESIPGGRCGSKYAMHVTGQGFVEWAVLSVSMGWGPIDGGASGLLPNNNDFRTGVTFWARIGDTSSNKVRLAMTDKYSRPEGGFCIETTTDMSLACFDTHGVDLTQLDTTWKQYRIPFGGLTQRNFGLPRERVDAASIYTVEFQFAPVTPFDFWVDDVAFY